MKQKGFKPVILSCDYSELAKRIAEKLGIERYFSNKIIYEGIVHSGRLKEPIIDEEIKNLIKENLNKLISIKEESKNLKRELIKKEQLLTMKDLLPEEKIKDIESEINRIEEELKKDSITKENLKNAFIKILSKKMIYKNKRITDINLLKNNLERIKLKVKEGK